MIESYYALGDGLSMDPLIAESPMPPGPASILASELARNHGCQKFKNLARERAPLNTTWRNGVHPILPSKGPTIVTLTVGLEDMVNMGLELSESGQILESVHESIASYRRLVRAIKRLLPGALIIGTTVPDPTFGLGGQYSRLIRFPSWAVPLFNQQLQIYAEDYATDGPGFVVADAFDYLGQPKAWSDPSNLQLSAYGAKVIAEMWLGECEKAGFIPFLAPYNDRRSEYS